MESLLNRYRNITVLLLVIVAQLVLLAVQVKNDQDVRIIRVWTVTAVTPAARVARVAPQRQHRASSATTSPSMMPTPKTASSSRRSAG